MFRLIFGVLLIVLSTALPFQSKRELAPSLTLHRLNALKDSIDQLNDVNKQIRCQEKAQELSRRKRMISPSLRLSELLDPLVPQSDSSFHSDDPCVAFYNAVPYYF